MSISGGPFAPCTRDCCRARFEPEANFHGEPDIPDTRSAEDLYEEAEDKMYAAAAASKRHRQRSLAFGCLVPIALGAVLLILALAGGGQ